MKSIILIIAGIILGWWFHSIYHRTTNWIEHQVNHVSHSILSSVDQSVQKAGDKTVSSMNENIDAGINLVAMLPDTIKF